MLLWKEANGYSRLLEFNGRISFTTTTRTGRGVASTRGRVSTPVGGGDPSLAATTAGINADMECDVIKV